MRQSLILTVTVLSTLLVCISLSMAGVQQAVVKAKNFDIIDTSLPGDNFITQGKIKWLETFNDTIPPVDWQIIDNDGSGAAWTFVQQLDFGGGSVVNPEAGQSFYWSTFQNANGFLIDEWLITPKLPAIEPGDRLHFYAGAIDMGFDDSLKIWVSTTDSLPGSFTQIAYFKVDGPLGAWNRYTFDLTPYAGSQIFVAVNYYIVNGGASGAHSDNVWVDHFVLEGLPKILISEFVVTPTEGEFIEIYNPNTEAIDLTDFYLTDATFAPANIYYYQIVEGGGGGGGFGDFHGRFPDSAMIGPGEYQTIAMNGTNFVNTYGFQPTYELFDTDAGILDMLEATPGSINNQGGLTNTGEVIILYYWNGIIDLVQDADYVIYDDGGEVPDVAVDKTGVSIDGPDADTLKSTYLNDTPIANQLSALNHSGGFSVHRIDYAEGAQVTAGGNGVTGADEMSEDLNNTFTNLSLPSPNAAYVTSEVELNPPQNLTATAGDKVVNLEWQVPLPQGSIELAYDDGTAEGSITIGGSAAGDLAVRFTPNIYPATLLEINVYFAETTDPTAHRIGTYTIWEGTTTGPTTALDTGSHPINRGMFERIDVSSAGVQITTDDFFISYGEVTDSVIVLAWDINSPSADRSWVNAPGIGLPWQTSGTIDSSFDNNYMIRAIVREGSGANAQVVELTPSTITRKMNLKELKKSLKFLKMNSNDKDFNFTTVHLDGSTPVQNVKPQNQNEITLSHRMPGYTIAGLLGYNIYRSEDGTSFINIGATDSLTLMYTDTTVTNETNYWYYVTAVHDEGESTPSDTVQSTPSGVTDRFSDHVSAAYVGSVTNEGSIGTLNDWLPPSGTGQGSGFQFNPPTSAGQRLFEGAVMIGVSDTQVSDAARDEIQEYDADFQFLTGFDSSQSAGPVTVYETSYNDDLAETPIGVMVTQTTFSVDTVGGDGILLFQLDITNNSGADLPMVHVGGFFDWDVAGDANDRGQVVVDSINTLANVNGGLPFFIEVLESHQGASPNSWVGVVPLSSNVFAGRRIAVSSSEVYPPNMTDADKWIYMTQNRATNPNGDGGSDQDHAQVFGLPAITISNTTTQRVGFAIVAGTSLSELVSAAREAQRIWVEGLANDMVILDPTGIEDQLVNVPLEYALHQNYPNPFNPTTTIRYDLKQTSDVTLRIFNLLGQEVRTLVNARQEAGYKDVVWDGLNNNKAQVASGIYIYRIEAGEFIQSRKMILMK